MPHQIFGQHLHWLIDENRCVSERQQFELFLGCFNHLAVGMTEARNDRATRAVEVAFALRIDQIRPVAWDGDGVMQPRVAMKDEARETFISEVLDIASAGPVLPRTFQALGAEIQMQQLAPQLQLARQSALKQIEELIVREKLEFPFVALDSR